MRIDGRGRVLEFEMNDKCAAGTGRFIEVMASALKVDLEEIGEISSKHTKDLTISSICTVFAESEVISLVSEGRSSLISSAVSLWRSPSGPWVWSEASEVRRRSSSWREASRKIQGLRLPLENRWGSD